MANPWQWTTMCHMGWECTNCFAVSFGSTACKSSYKGHNCLEGSSGRKFLYGESPGQKIKSHSVVARRKVRLTRTECFGLAHLSVCVHSYLHHAFSQWCFSGAAAECWSQEHISGKRLQASFCQHWKHYWQHNSSFSAYPSVTLHFTLHREA